MQIVSIIIESKSGRRYTMDTRGMSHAAMFVADLAKRVSIVWINTATR